MTGAQYLMTGAKCEYFWCPVYNTYLDIWQTTSFMQSIGSYILYDVMMITIWQYDNNHLTRTTKMYISVNIFEY